MIINENLTADERIGVRETSKEQECVMFLLHQNREDFSFWNWETKSLVIFSISLGVGLPFTGVEKVLRLVWFL